MADEIRLPPGFAWGTATSSHQAEGGNVHNDWWEWEQQPGRVANGERSGRANDFWHRYDEDFALLADLGLTHFRLSVEWSRVEPDDGRVDVAALDQYARMLEAARRRGITPWVSRWSRALSTRGATCADTSTGPRSTTSSGTTAGRRSSA